MRTIGLSFGVVLLVAFVMMFMSQTLYEQHQEENRTFDIYNFTENKLIWNYSANKDTISENFSDMTGLNYEEIQSRRISNLVHKTADWIGYSGMELSKWAIEFGYTHPEYDFGFWVNLLKYWLIAMIALALSPLLIPLIALIYLGFVGIKKLVKKYKKKELKSTKNSKIRE